MGFVTGHGDALTGEAVTIRQLELPPRTQRVPQKLLAHIDFRYSWRFRSGETTASHLVYDHT